ncbi:hypothetical protein BFJ70_g17499 [Fusarium oxysporum]|nr:hypothetical protein BFJ70_g17499 [Fusarium oxysporum]
MTWKPSNVKTAPYSFFLLHQQYHVTMILLHRPWAKYGSISGDNASTGSHPSPDSDRMANPDSPGHHLGHATEGSSMSTDDRQRAVHGSRTSLARGICTQQAIRVGRIFWQHRQRFDGRKIFITGIQHAGTASIALIAALAYQRSEPNCQTYIGYLEILSDAVSDMSPTYHPATVARVTNPSVGEPAAREVVTLSTAIHQPPFVLVRREADAKFSQPLKKRWPSVYRQTSDFASSKPPFLGTPSQPTPSLADKAYGMPYGQQS